MINLLIADGNELSRLGLESSLGVDFNIINVVNDTKDLLDSLDKCEVDIILIDYTSKGFCFHDLKKILKYNSKIIAITSEKNVPEMAKALQLGIDGHLKKTCSVEEIKDSINATVLGETFICGEILDAFEKHSISLNNVLDKSYSCDGVILTQRELEVIKLIAEGNSGPQIANQLFLSNHTINAHRKNIFSKLQINSTSSLVIYAVKAGILDLNQFAFEN